MVKHVLSYFGIMGRGEPIRLAFVQAGLPFTNKVIGFPEFSQLKPTLPAGQLPVLELLEEDGSPSSTTPGMIGQSSAILRYVGTLGGSGLYPSQDPLAALKVDEAMDTIEEAVKYFVFTMMGPKGVFLQDDKTLSDEEKIQIRTKLMDPAYGEKNAAFFLAVLEKMLENKQTGWLVGESVTIADLRAHQFVAWMMGGQLDGVPVDSMDAYPLLKALYGKVEALPRIAAFRATYGAKYSTTFDFVPPHEE